MKVMVKVGYSFLGLEVKENIGAFLSALEGAQVYSNHFGRGSVRFLPDGTKEEPCLPSVEFVPDSAIGEATGLVQDLTKAAENAETRAYEARQRADKLEKELSELKAKVAGLNGGNGQEEAHS